MKRANEDEGSESRKRNKTNMQANSQVEVLKYSHILNPAEVNCGIMVTCTARCVQDVLLDLDKFVKLHLNLAGDEATEPEVKGGKKLTSEFFDVLDTMVKRQDSTKELEIVEFAKFVFAQLALPENKEMANKWIRHCNRFLPVQVMCDATTASTISSSSSLTELVSKHFPASEQTTEETKAQTTEATDKDTTTSNHETTYAVAYRGRSNNELHREDIQKIFKELVGKDYHVNFKDPELLISVEVIKTICAVSVIKNEDFTNLKKFNTGIYIKGQ